MLKVGASQTPGDCSPGHGAVEGGFGRPCNVLLVIFYSAAKFGRWRKYLAMAYHSRYIREPYIVEIRVQALSLKLELTDDGLWFASKRHWEERGTHVLCSAPARTSDLEVKC